MNFDALDSIGSGGQIANADFAEKTERPKSVASVEGELVPPVPGIFYNSSKPDSPKYAKGNFSTLGRKRQVSR